MILDFLLWIAATCVAAACLQGAGLPRLAGLLAAGWGVALVMTGVRALRNRRFRREAAAVTATVTGSLPPLRTGGLPRTQLSLGGRTLTLTLEEAPEPGATVPLWQLGRRVLARKPSPWNDLLPLLLCALVTAALGLGYLCTLLLPDPTR